MTTRVDMTVLRAIIQQFPQKADDWIGGIATDIHGKIVEDLTETSSGAPYIRYRPRRTGVASKVGDAPNVDIGTLRASMKVRRMGMHHWRVEDGVENGIWLEDGTETMGHRPFVGPAFDEWDEGRIARSATGAGLFDGR